MGELNLLRRARIGVLACLVAHALGAGAVTAHIPIVVLTAMDLTEADRARLDGSVQGILAKASFSAEDLLTEVRRATSRATG